MENEHQSFRTLPNQATLASMRHPVFYKLSSVRTPTRARSKISRVYLQRYGAYATPNTQQQTNPEGSWCSEAVIFLPV